MTDTKLKFGKGNAKLDEDNTNKVIHTFSLPSGHSCPGACECLARADKDTGRIKDGIKQQFRCFSASMEAYNSSVRDSRWRNMELLKEARSTQKMKDLIIRSLPRTATNVRIHVGGDFFNQSYFDAWLDVTHEKSDILFYAYTKSLPFWVSRLVDIPANFELSASRGGKYDHLIDELGLRCAEVVWHPEQAAKLNKEIDHDDSHAMGKHGKDSFALLLHGVQKKGSEASEAVKRLKAEEVKFSYTQKETPARGRGSL